MGGGPMGAAMGGGEKPKSFRKTMRTFLKYLEALPVSLIAGAHFRDCQHRFHIVGPKMLGNATTKLFKGVVAKATHVPGATIDFALYRPDRCLFCWFCMWSAPSSAYIQGYIMSGIAMKVTYNFRKNIAEKIKRMPLKYFDTKTHGEA